MSDHDERLATDQERQELAKAYQEATSDEERAAIEKAWRSADENAKLLGDEDDSGLTFDGYQGHGFTR